MKFTEIKISEFLFKKVQKNLVVSKKSAIFVLKKGSNN